MNAPRTLMDIRETAEGVTFPIRVQPRASCCECAGVQDGAVRLKITAPPVEGRANEACIRLLAEALNLRKRQITILSGLKSRNKVVAVAGLSAAALRERLAGLAATGPDLPAPQENAT
jgi:hypothetical protein